MGQTASTNTNSFTNRLKRASGTQWDRVVTHKFTTELATGTIDKSVLRKYLVQDHKFLDSFVVLLSSMVAKCRCLKDRIPACQFLAVITGDENTYFERCFEAMGISQEEASSAPNAECTDKFINLMLEVSKSGNLAEMLAVLVVCEWSYLTWGEGVKKQTVREDFTCYEWVDLHSGEGFQSVVDYLRNLLDLEEQYLDEEQKKMVQDRFLQAVDLEEQFFDYAYSSS